MQSVDLVEIFKSPSHLMIPFGVTCGLIIVVLLTAIVVGNRIGVLERHRQGYSGLQADRLPGKTSHAATVAILGLLLAFSFNLALESREARQATFLQEVAALSTAFDLAGLLEDPGRTDLQTKLLSYGQTRIATKEDARSLETWQKFLERTTAAQETIWPATLAALEATDSDEIRVAVARSITDMLDAHTYRLSAATKKIPWPAKLAILAVVTLTVFFAGNLAGIEGRRPSWRLFVFTGLVAAVLIIIEDLERPLEGAIRTNTTIMLLALDGMQKTLTSGEM